MDKTEIVVVGSGNAALCAAIAACEAGCDVLVVEKAKPDLAGGNSKYTAGAMRFAYHGHGDVLALLHDRDDPRLADTDFGTYDDAQFAADLCRFNEGQPLSDEQRILVDQSYPTLAWLAGHGVAFEPIYSRQSFQKDGTHVFWGGLTLAARGEGVGLVESELAILHRLGGRIRYDCGALECITENGRVTGIRVENSAGQRDEILARAIILGSGGFEANAEMRRKYLGPDWLQAKVRGTPHNTGTGLEMAFALGALAHGNYSGCHATPMDLHMKEYGNLDIPHGQRKQYRKICYFLGVMINANGERFVDEGYDFRNYTYAQFGRAILAQPGHLAWQIFDAKVDALLYEEYRFDDAHFVVADRLDDLVMRLDGVDDKAAACATLAQYNESVDDAAVFDPARKDGKATVGLALPKSNWAQRLDMPPYKAYPVTAGITFSYGGLKVDEHGCVIDKNGAPIPGLYGCGELVGGVFWHGYPGGSGLTSGAVFGRRAGLGAAGWVQNDCPVLVPSYPVRDAPN